MRFGTSTASLFLAAFTAAAQAAPFDNLLSLVQQLQDEATALSTEYGAEDDEVAALMSQLSLCESGSDDDEEEEEDPAPAPTPEPTSAATPVPEEEEDDGEEDDDEEENEPAPSPPASGDFAFALGQSWNYNLASPVNTDVEVDVFFIDMGEFCRWWGERATAAAVDYTAVRNL